MQLFWAEIVDEQRAILPPEEARHCLKVLRHQTGDLIHCCDGVGTMYEARIARTTAKEVHLDLLQAHPGWGEHGRHLCLAVSPLRLRDRFEWLLEKAVELGVNEIVPVRCQRTDKYKAQFKTARAQTILLTAAKQCLRSAIPQLHEPVALETWLEKQGKGGCYLAVAEATQGLAQADLAPQDRISLLIGPEGDFTPEEQAAAQAAGFLPVHLGRTRLRTETAGIFALSQVKVAWGY